MHTLYLPHPRPHLHVLAVTRAWPSSSGKHGVLLEEVEMMRGDVVQEREVEAHGRRSGSCKPRIRVLISSLLVVSLYHLIYRN